MVGELYAFLSAVSWALAVVLFKRSGESTPPFPLNLFKTVLSFVLLALTLVVLSEPLLPRLEAGVYFRLVVSGVVGITVSDTLFLAALGRLGAGRTAIVECSYSPLLILLSYLFLDEVLAPLDFAGLLLVLSAVLVVAHPGRSGVSARDSAVGIALGILAMGTLAVSVVLIKPDLARVSAVWASAVRTLAAAATLASAGLVLGDRRAVFACFVPAPVWRFSVPASILGTYVALLFWILGFQNTLVSRAAIANQSTTIFVILFALVILREPITKRKALAVVLGVSGVVVILA